MVCSSRFTVYQRLLALSQSFAMSLGGALDMQKIRDTHEAIPGFGILKLAQGLNRKKMSLPCTCHQVLI
jgi:hypothetical protein